MNLLLHHHHSAAEEEFHFWTGDRFRFRNHLKNGRLAPHSPRPRTLLGGDDDAYNLWSAPLLPHRENSSSPSLLSPRSRTRAIERGRNELMEMIRDLPESSFELSLKDIVVDVEEQKNFEEDDRKADESAVEEKDIDVNDQNKKKKKKRRKDANNNKARVRQVSRCSSMESGVFLIKLFPAFLTSKKTKPTIQSKVSSRMSSFDNTYRIDDLQSSKNNCRSRTSSNIRSLSSSCRKDDGESLPAGCWPFELGKQKIRRQKTCVF